MAPSHFCQDSAVVRSLGYEVFSVGYKDTLEEKAVPNDVNVWTKCFQLSSSGSNYTACHAKKLVVRPQGLVLDGRPLQPYYAYRIGCTRLQQHLSSEGQIRRRREKMRSSWAANLGALLLSGAALGHPTTSGHVVHESVKQLPQGWRHFAPADDLLTVRLSVALKQPGMSELKARLELTSDPKQPEYGAHVSRDLMATFQEPTADSYAVVASWLQTYDIHDFVQDGAWVRLNTTVGKANRLLDCTFSKYQYQSQKPVLRAKGYALPSYVSEHVDFVFPVSQFVNKPPRRDLRAREASKVKRQSASELQRHIQSFRQD